MTRLPDHLNWGIISMIYQLGDVNIIFDNGNNREGDMLQRREGDRWEFFKPEGELVFSPIDFHTLPFGEYRLVSFEPGKLKLPP